MTVFILIVAMACLNVGLATVLIKRVTGTSGSQTLNDISGLTTQLNTADVWNDGSSNPVRIPASGTNYSFWSSNCLVCSVAPVTEINNIVVYSSGSNPFGTGIDMKVSTVASANGTTTSNYTQATGTAGVTGLEMGANYGHSITTPTDFFTYTLSSPLSIPGTFVTGTDTAADSSAGRFGYWLIEQLTVGTTASSGTTPSAAVTYLWDEF